MFKSVKRISALKCLSSDGLSFSPRISSIRIFRNSSAGLKERRAETIVTIADEVNLETFMQRRQEEARRSFLVKIPGLECWPTLCDVCSSVGKIKNAFHYRSSENHFLLIEMCTELQLNELLRKTLEIQRSSDYCNQFLLLNENTKFESKPLKNIKNDEFINNSGKKHSKNSENLIQIPPQESSKRLLDNELLKSRNLTDLIRNCYNIFKVDDIATRKRFLMCRQIEVLCTGFLPNAVAYPFGSSINGFGNHESDLDICLVPLIKKCDALVFFQRNYLNYPSEKMRIHLAIITDILRNFGSGCSDIFYVKNARVPIVKFRNKFTDVDCDLSLYNLHGIAMSHILFHSGAMDWRIRALVIFLKLWAQRVGLVVKSPSPNLSNFSLCLMTLFFFQQLKMLPPFNIFSSDEREIFWEGSNLSQVESYTKTCLKLNNNKSVGTLLKLFFEFYSSFDFRKWGISLNKGEVISNSIGYPLYIENPLNFDMNVSVNVKVNEIKYARGLMREAANILSQGNEDSQIQRLFCLNYGKKKQINVQNVM